MTIWYEWKWYRLLTDSLFIYIQCHVLHTHQWFWEKVPKNIMEGLNVIIFNRPWWGWNASAKRRCHKLIMEWECVSARLFSDLTLHKNNEHLKIWVSTDITTHSDRENTSRSGYTSRFTVMRQSNKTYIQQSFPLTCVIHTWVYVACMVIFLGFSFHVCVYGRRILYRLHT